LTAVLIAHKDGFEDPVIKIGAKNPIKLNDLVHRGFDGNNNQNRGRVVTVLLQHVTVVLCILPNSDQHIPVFLNNLQECMQSSANPIILGGDFTKEEDGTVSDLFREKILIPGGFSDTNSMSNPAPTLDESKFRY
jgi:hypothetical protein